MLFREDIVKGTSGSDTIPASVHAV